MAPVGRSTCPVVSGLPRRPNISREHNVTHDLNLQLAVRFLSTLHAEASGKQAMKTKTQGLASPQLPQLGYRPLPVRWQVLRQQHLRRVGESRTYPWS